MKLTTFKEIKKLTLADISNKIIEVKRTIFNLQFQRATKQVIKPDVLKSNKRLLAQLLTAEHQYKQSKI